MRRVPVFGLMTVATLTCPAIQAAEVPTLFKREPYKTWAAWIKALPKVDGFDDFRRLPLGQQQSVERVIWLLNSVEMTCDDLAFKTFGHFSPKPQREVVQLVTSEVEEAYERDGEQLCDAFYARLGPGGDLVKYVRRVRDEERVGDHVQVLWRSKEICDRPTEFWGADFGSAPTDAGAVKAVCDEAKK